MGRLECNIWVNTWWSHGCFNSTTVRLEGDVELSDKWKVNQFQFHYGTVKRIDDLKRLAGCTLFQFHNDSIKSIGTHDLVPTTSGFNSTLGRLETIPIVYDKYCDIEFQSHYGLIKSRPFLRPLPSQIPRCFYPQSHIHNLCGLTPVRR